MLWGQAAIEGELDKRGGKNFGPPSGCGMTVFLDDISMPEVDCPARERRREVIDIASCGFIFLLAIACVFVVSSEAIISPMLPTQPRSRELPRGCHATFPGKA